MKKVIRDGKVAVLYSPGYGSGWGSNTQFTELIFHPKLVELVENNQREKITEELVKQLLVEDGIVDEDEDPYVYVSNSNVGNLKIEWLEEGTIFEIEEYDGSESIHIIGGRNYLQA